MNAKAFKIETHAWVGQQVLNDLEDGKITVSIGGVNYEYQVDPQVVNALRQNPDIYRMGNVGTDGLPDMVAAQLVVHPGVKDAWQTDDWLKWIYKGAYTPQQKAFAYGYLAHAAADVFSHTYVNEYSGDIFLLTDGEIINEMRHLALEKYIVQRTPPLTDARGVEIGKPYEVLTTPASFIRDRLILNDTVADQYKKGKAIHLSAVQNLREELANAYEPLGKLDVLITQLLVQYFADIKLNDEQAAKIYSYAQKINDLINSGSGIDQLQSAKDDFLNTVVKTAEIGTELQKRLDGALVNIAEISARLDAKALELADNQSVYNAQFNICFAQTEICKANLGCSGLPTRDARNDCRNWCDRTTRNMCEDQLAALYNLITTLIQVKQSIEAELTQAHLALSSAVQDATTIAINTLQAQNDILNGLIDTGQRMTSDLNMMRAQIDGWRADIVSGMDAYVLANAELLKESMKEGGDMFQPLKDWYACWGMAVAMGMPGPLNQAQCSVEKRMENIQNAISHFESLLNNFPVIEEFNKLKQQIMDKVEAAANDALMRLAEKATGVPIEKLVDLFKEPMSAERLNSIFTEDSRRGLPLIGDIAQRVDAEMYLGPDGYFDPEKYSVAYNSVLFAKLSLLSAEQLNQLAWDAGVMLPTMYGDLLYPGDGINSENILFGFIRSIDGNHQWMALKRNIGTDSEWTEGAPPYPRLRGYTYDEHDRIWPRDMLYGYAFGKSADGQTGLRIWQDANARDNVFRRVFHGPLVPGIEVPESINFKPIPWLNFRYPVCMENPFPLSVYDQTCKIANIPASLPPQAIQALTNPPGKSQEAHAKAPGQTVRASKRQHGAGVGKRVTMRSGGQPVLQVEQQNGSAVGNRTTLQSIGKHLLRK